ncbi:hypothetical protein H4R18_004855 [Coemansia javaensis]|uniref:Major facilitator superfamily (MFS) profile domain-containing protein n=1 Tax=Coemansia javaensis TaxID=2761396 RepID=A0A9W8H373_9FUNG|nr:hypothetical protein H4R18_004855 [Coemansia javaensis]
MPPACSALALWAKRLWIQYESLLDRSGPLRAVRHAPATIWALSSFSLFLDTFVYALTVAMLPNVLQDDMGAPESANGVVTTMFGVGAIVGGLAAGVASDRTGDRRAMQTLGALLYMTAGLVFYFARHYYQMLVFRLINGVASGVACTLLYAAMGDVYPASLLGFKVAVICFFNNVAYTIGPICGERLFDVAGVKGPAAAVIALSLLKFFLYATMAVEPLAIRQSARSQEPAAKQAAAAGIVARAPHDWEALSQDLPEPGVAAAPCPAGGCGCRPACRSPGDTLDGRSDISFARLVARPPVLIATVAIVSIIGIQCMLEGIVPLHLSDKFGYADSGGITFVILGLVFTVMAPVAGKVNDVLIARHGEAMRYYAMLAGSLATIPTMVLMAYAGSYGLMMVGYALFAATNMCVFIPAQSAYGDLVNEMGSNAMARGYAVSTIAWAVGAICLPPIGSALYTRSGFALPVIAVPAVACAISAGACLAFVVSGRWQK